MKTSELIRLLLMIAMEHGDLPVYIWDRRDEEQVTDVTLQQNEEFDLPKRIVIASNY